MHLLGGRADAVALFRLYNAVTPLSRASRSIASPMGMAPGRSCRAPAGLTPILRFADVELFLQEAPEGAADPTQLQGFVQVGVAKEDQPHYLRVLVRPGTDATPLIRFGLGVIGTRAERRDHGHDHGVICPIRTYELPLEHRVEEAGFTTVATVTLLMKETLVRVAEPAMVPAIR